MLSFIAKGKPIMKKLFALSLLMLACVSLLPISRARAAANDEAEIRQLLDRWGKAFRAKDINGIMSIYAPGDTLVGFDIVPPLQYVGWDAYKKDYEDFLAQCQGPIDLEVRDLHVTAGDNVAFIFALERIGGTLKNGQKSEVWVRATECYRKIKGHWLAVHDHISVPADVETGKAALDLKP
jgi:uncharacterized protein (TIGR02246 family)